MPAHPDRFFLNSRLVADGRTPVADARFPFEASYGYHFDAQLIGRVLRDHATRRGVHRREGRVAAVDVAADGDVAALLLDGGDRIAGDLFVDASGFAGLIAQETLGTRFLGFSDNLFNDAAVVMATDADPSLPVHTHATALANGWAWRIALSSRTGNGYVYSTRHCSADAAEATLRAHLGVGDTEDARHLSMKVGRVEESWRGNCLAVGLAQGFIEPLEATALHLVQATVEGFIRAYADVDFTPRHRPQFNRQIARRYEGIRDYIVAHYRLNRRTDTAYWRDNAGHDRLSDDLKAAPTRSPSPSAPSVSPRSWPCATRGC